MSNLFKKSAAYAFAIISAVFTFVPEAVFQKITLIPKESFEQFAWIYINISEINIIINRMLAFALVWGIVAVIYGIYLCLRKKVSMKGDNYQITVEYGDLLKIKKCKKVITFDECFSTKIGRAHV